MTSNELEIFKQSILDDVRVMMQTTGQVTQYIGARYVPLFADPLEWSNTKEYEPLTIVLHQGNSFTSRQFVPRGIDINNTEFWANTGNYNAQIEQYRQEVITFDGRITANTQAIEKTTKKNIILFGDSWCADSPGIGIGKRIFNLMHGDKTLIGNYGSSGAQFGTADMTSNSNNTETELNKSITELSVDVRSSVTHLIMICGTNNIGTNQIDPQKVISHWSAFKSAYPNARLYMLFSSPRAFFNEHMQGNICNRIYMPLITGCNLSGVTTFKNSLTWLKTQNEEEYWGSTDTWYANHPNEKGRDTFASIAANAIESGVDVETFTLINFNYTDVVNVENSYVEAFLKGTEVTLIGYISFKDLSAITAKTTNVIEIPKLCFLPPIAYVRSPALGVRVNDNEVITGIFNTNGSAPIQITIGTNIPTAFYTINMRYEIL